VDTSLAAPHRPTAFIAAAENPLLLTATVPKSAEAAITPEIVLAAPPQSAVAARAAPSALLAAIVAAVAPNRPTTAAPNASPAAPTR